MLAGGFGSAVLEEIGGPGVSVLRFGLPDAFVPHGDRRRLLEDVGLTASAVAAAACLPEFTPAGLDGRPTRAARLAARGARQLRIARSRRRLPYWPARCASTTASSTSRARAVDLSATIAVAERRRFVVARRRQARPRPGRARRRRGRRGCVRPRQLHRGLRRPPPAGRRRAGTGGRRRLRPARLAAARGREGHGPRSHECTPLDARSSSVHALVRHR